MPAEHPYLGLGVGPVAVVHAPTHWQGLSSNLVTPAPHKGKPLLGPLDKPGLFPLQRVCKQMREEEKGEKMATFEIES